MAAFGVSSFQSIWYWVLHILVWTLVTHRTLGVPYDMLLRARRLPEVTAQTETLAVVQCGRIVAVYQRLGIPIALLGGFLLAGLAVVGFLNGVELAQAAFLLLFPLAVIAYSTLATALMITERRFRGDVLVRILSRRHFWHQVVAVTALFAALAVAASRHARIVML